MATSPKQSYQAPRLPRHPRAGNLDTLADNSEYSSLLISGGQLNTQNADNVLFEQMLFRHVSFHRSILKKLRLFDSRAEESDFSGAVWEQARFRRVEFIGCRFLGIQLWEAELENILFKECILENAIMNSAKMLSAVFEKCVLRNASMEAAILTESIFHNCDLSNADFRAVKFSGTDLRGSTLHGVQIGAHDVKGAIIDSAQAIQMASLLGVTVRDSDEFSLA